MKVRITLSMPYALEALLRSKPDEVCAAIERSVAKALARQMNVNARIDFDDREATEAPDNTTANPEV